MVLLSIGALSPRTTPGETGHFDIMVVFSAIKCSLEEFVANDYDEDLLDEPESHNVPVVLLPQLIKGSIWRDRGRIAQLLGYRRTLSVRVNETDFETITGSEILQTHVIKSGQMVQWDVEAAARPPLKNYAQNEFLGAKFVRLTIRGENLSDKFAYAPCSVLFRDCYYGSDLIGPRILAGQFQSPDNWLYHEATSGWEEVDRVYRIDVRNLVPFSDELFIARLICRERGRKAMEQIRRSIQNCTSREQSIYLSAQIPISGEFSLIATGDILPFSDNIFICNQIVAIKGANPIPRLICMRTEVEGDAATGAGTSGNSPRSPIPAPPAAGGRIAPDSTSEGNSAQLSAAIPQVTWHDPWSSSPRPHIERKKEIRPPTRRRWSKGIALPIEGSFSTTLAGSSRTGLPRGYQVPIKVPEHVVQMEISDDETARNFAAILIELAKFSCPSQLVVGIDTPEFQQALIQIAHSKQWAHVPGTAAGPLPRKFYAVMVRITLFGDMTRPLMVVDFERPAGLPSPDHFYIIDPPIGITEETVLLDVIRRLDENHGRLPRGQLRFRKVRNQKYALPHGDAQSAWNRRGWGNSRLEHHAFKVYDAMCELLRPPKPTDTKESQTGESSLVA